MPCRKAGGFRGTGGGGIEGSEWGVARQEAATGQEDPGGQAAPSGCISMASCGCKCICLCGLLV